MGSGTSRRRPRSVTGPGPPSPPSPASAAAALSLGQPPRRSWCGLSLTRWEDVPDVVHRPFLVSTCTHHYGGPFPLEEPIATIASTRRVDRWYWIRTARNTG